MKDIRGKVLQIPKMYSEEDTKALLRWVDSLTIEQVHQCQMWFERRTQRRVRRILTALFGS